MKAQELKTPPKISVKIWQPVLEAFEQKLDALCLRRDAYLNKVLAKELPHVDEEVAIANSPEAEQFILERLDALERKPVSLTLNPELIAQLNEICQRRRIPRDAFFNRLFLVLAAGPKLNDRLFFRGVLNWQELLLKEYGSEYWMQGCYPLEAGISPFWAIRDALELCVDAHRVVEQQDPATGKTIKLQRDLDDKLVPLDSVYTVYFSEGLKDVDLRGMNCYLPDWQIPNSPAATERKKLDELFDF